MNSNLKIPIVIISFFVLLDLYAATEKQNFHQKIEQDNRFPSSHRTIDGTGNNLTNTSWGSANIELLRLTTVGYMDEVDSPSGENRLSSREISQICMAQEKSIPNTARVSNFFWQWGQFLDHDLSITPIIDPPEIFDIPVPAGDQYFDPAGIGNLTIPFDRSFYTKKNGIRQQVNEITSYIDASVVYGSDLDRALELRRLNGTGRLKMSKGRLLPFNKKGFPNAPSSSDPSYFLAGDFRANEQVGLTAMHTLFVREHNFWTRIIRRLYPKKDGDRIYEMARAIVAAEIQAITYNEFLPILLGPNALTPYKGYNSNVNPGIANIFSTAAYRFGHSMLPLELLRLNQWGEPLPEGSLALADAFFRSGEIIDKGGIEPILRGLAAQVAQGLDPYIVDGVRNFLFGSPGAGGFDLAALNIQRGRDHGLPDYNQARIDFGLRPVTNFSGISSDIVVQDRLAEAYDTVNDIDVWVGGLAEKPVPGALVGETFHAILKEQFQRLRDGDRFWYHCYLPQNLIRYVDSQTLADIIRRNSRIGKEIQNNVFIVPSEKKFSGRK